MKKYIVKKDQFKKITLDKTGEYLVELVGPGAKVEIVGAFRASGSEKKEVSVTICHKAPHTRADTTLKGVGEDSSFIKFVGRIIIDEDCGDSQSFLTERILLLSETAKAEAIPDLEIKTDDVKCSHAASVSYIPEEHLFYLQSRGIPRKKAEEMVVEGFLEV